MTNNELDDIVESIIDEKNDRALLILASSLIDDLLFNILNKHFLQPIKNEENLLKGDNPLSTFSSRVKILYRLGLIDQSFLTLLDKVRDIRNKCAHKTDISADKSPLKEKLSHLHSLLKNKKSFQLTKTRYLINDEIQYSEIKITYITVCVLLKAVYDNIGQIIPNVKSINTSTR